MSMPWYEKYIGVPMLMLHDKVYKATEGRIGHTIPGGPSQLILHTVGAKTGQQRANSLSYARDGDDYLVVASKGGEPKAPGWYHNLKANPNVEINVGPKRFGVTAKPVLPDDPEYAAAMADREQHARQQGPLHRLPETDDPSDPGRRAFPLEQLFGQQFQGLDARRRRRGISAATRRRDGVHHHLVDPELVGEGAHLFSCFRW